MNRIRSKVLLTRPVTCRLAFLNLKDTYVSPLRKRRISPCHSPPSIRPEMDTPPVQWTSASLSARTGLSGSNRTTTPVRLGLTWSVDMVVQDETYHQFRHKDRRPTARSSLAGRPLASRTMLWRSLNGTVWQTPTANNSFFL